MTINKYLTKLNYMEIIEETGKVNFAKIIDLLKAEWPEDWGELSDEKLIQEFEKSSDYKYDINKYLYNGNQIIGWYRYSVWPRKEDNKTDVHTLDIVVNPEYQGKGLGNMLMNDLISDCKKRGLKKLLSRTIEGNIQSYKMHERNNFKVQFQKGKDIVWKIDL